MSEISDAVQIIRITYDGIEIVMKVGSGSIQMMQKALETIEIIKVTPEIQFI